MEMLAIGLLVVSGLVSLWRIRLSTRALVQSALRVGYLQGRLDQHENVPLPRTDEEWQRIERPPPPFPEYKP
jgi:hypothetical protein